jgi:hypothetical protein
MNPIDTDVWIGGAPDPRDVFGKIRMHLWMETQVVCIGILERTWANFSDEENSSWSQEAQRVSRLLSKT